jgi:hypothetical protein
MQQLKKIAICRALRCANGLLIIRQTRYGNTSVPGPKDRNPTFRLPRFKIGMGASPVEVDPSGSRLASQMYSLTAPSYLVRNQLVAN